MIRNVTSHCLPQLRTSIRCYVSKAGNPGLNKLSKKFNDAAQLQEDPEGFGDMESDFMETHKSHKQYEKEVKLHRQKIQHWIVGNKYFKQNEPNFLTYAEKEQIKLLYARDSEEWNPENLAESFPATPDTIAKILKAKWTAASPKRIERHDESVMKNWSLFKEGKLDDLNPILREHIVKFANRKVDDLKNLATVVRPKREMPKPNITEFSSIISGSVKLRKIAQTQIKGTNDIPLKITPSSNPFKEIGQSNKPSAIEPARIKPPPTLSQQSPTEDETYLTDKIYNKKPMRFQDLIHTNPDVEQDHNELLLHRVENPQGTGIVSVNANNDQKAIRMGKFEMNEVEIKPHDIKNMSSGIREKIRIPRNLWKRGYTYKLNDCYYDDDGELLYRVPGMTGAMSN